MSRVFRRYRRPRYRVMEAFGLPLPKDAYDEFWALRGISLELRRGDSLGLIGQNGAGKSTLLNIICGRLQASSGTVAVRGTIQALMDLGTGFYPEFTGRENILSALAYQGVTGRAANDRFDDIVDFSELADFIDQPIKTYSSGMYARLAFSTATAIVPDVLIIDEVLGAGDAYFSAKCAERMRRLTQESGATVLFVSHDIGAVQRMCERAIWIDRGHIRMAGGTLDISKSYYADVTAREEARLRAQTTVAVARMRRRDGPDRDEAATLQFLFRLVTESGEAPCQSHPIRRITLVTSDGRRLDVLPGAPMDNDQSQSAYLVTDMAYVLWSRPKNAAGEIVRCIENTGGKDLQAPICFQDLTGVGCAAQSIEIEHSVQAGEAIAIEIYGADGYRRLGLLTPAADPLAWGTDSFPIDAESHRSAAPVIDQDAPAEARASHPVPDGPRDRWETDEARFVDISAYNRATNTRQHIFGFGELMAFRVTVELSVTVPVCWLVCLIFDGLGNRVSLLVHEFPDGLDRGLNEIWFHIDRPTLRQGEYVVSFELLPIFDYNWSGPQRIPYLCHWDRCLYLKIDEDYHGTISLGLVALPSTVTVNRPVAADRQDGMQPAAEAAG
ncbi:MAG TPA: ABC transporter ATP-binding protein [Stellaceae bacterium]|nr:ABC transporter ATP-binding protein [Stellaceae bacterium]